MNELLHLEELRNQSYQDLRRRNEIVKRWFDGQKSTLDTFREGDLVLKWDEDRAKPGKHKKFESMWSGPYVVAKCIGKNAFELAKLNGCKLPISVNGQYLK